MGQGNYLAAAMQASGRGAALRAHLEHALRGYDATRERPTFLADFTAAC